MTTATVAFDLVGTLFSLDAPRRVLEQHGAPSTAFDIWFSGALRDYFARSHSGNYTPLREVLETTLPRTARLVGWELDDRVTSEVMNGLGELTPTKGAEEAVNELANAGWQIIALTNSSRELAERLLRRNGIEAHFQDLISCDQLGVSKPHPRVYRAAMKASKGDTWLIAAHAWDVGGALEAGMRAIWVSSAEHLYPKFLPAPDLMTDGLLSAAEFLVQDEH
jgi:2-haloacid dehalogenase